MSTWTVELTNEEIVNEPEGDFGAWRRLKKYCDKNNLGIKHLYFEGEEFKPVILSKPAEYLFIIQDGLAICSGGGAKILNDFRRGLGSLSTSMNRYRIEWRESNIKNRNYTEVLKGIPSFYVELAIPYKPEE